MAERCNNNNFDALDGDCNTEKMDIKANCSSATKFHLVISTIQKINVYETKARYYLAGSNNMQTKFRVLKIDRTEPKDLVVVDDKIEYSHKEFKDMLTMISEGNRSKPGQKSSSGATRTVSSFGIVGFVKFMEGYYMILITKRRRVAMIGHHTIYKVEDTSMIYIPNDTVRYSHADETRYVKMFQNVDLSSNFYFSYSYDLTHTFQYNMSPPVNMELALLSNVPLRLSDTIIDDYHLGSSHACDTGKTGNDNLESEVVSSCANANEPITQTNSKRKSSDDGYSMEYGVRSKAYKKLAWNAYLLAPVEDCLHHDWLLYITHGFIGQSNISVYGRPILITVIARRSNKYAGTRFLKRGANAEGDVANEVETEQIVFDSSKMSLHSGRFTSFVQMRGSIPSHWSQDISKMVPKPPIILDIGDPYCHSAGLHFNQLFRRYGSPIIALNLVKKREKKKHESMLREVYTETIEYLNQFIADEHHIYHRSFDMARVNKAKEANVMPRLAKIAYKFVKKTGIFQSCPSFYCNVLRPNSNWLGLQGKVMPNGCIKQCGVVRVNCVDCLDRTNTAQFALGKVALAYQLYALGVLEKPELEFDSDAIRMLEELYEDHGDTLALQYGGSQLVHRIKTYRKMAPWTSQSRDIMQTLSRYYSNAFSDADKQNAINLFLGVFVPDENKLNIWALPTDYYLHHPPAMGQIVCHRRSYTQWWEDPVARHLPLPYEEAIKGTPEEKVEIVRTTSNDEKVDGYFDFYRPFEFSIMLELFTYSMSHSVRDFMPNFTTDFSPFSVRIRPGKRREEMGNTSTSGSTNPSLTGQSSTSSTASSSTSSSTDSADSSSCSSCDEDTITDPMSANGETSSYLSFRSLFPTMKAVYGVEPKAPNSHDVSMYKRFTSLGKYAICQDGDSPKTATPYSVTLIQQSAFSLDSLYKVTPPTISRQSKEIYKNYTRKGQVGASLPGHNDYLLYQQYVSSRFR